MGACLTKECKKNKNGYLQAGKRKQTVKELERFPCWIGSFHGIFSKREAAVNSLKLSYEAMRESPKKL